MGLLVGHLPLHPGLVPFRALFPIVVSARKSLYCEHLRGGKRSKVFFGDCLPHSSGLPLGVLKHINILGDALDLEVIALHFIMQRQEVEGVPACEPRLEM